MPDHRAASKSARCTPGPGGSGVPPLGPSSGRAEGHTILEEVAMRVRRAAAREMVACIHGNQHPSVWAAEECDCISPDEAAAHLV